MQFSTLTWRICLLAGLCLGIGVVQAQPHRIVVLGGSITEIIYALGEEQRVVGADVSSIYPAEAQALPQLGYFRQTSSEGVISLNPDLVLALEGAGPPTALKQIEAAGVQVLSVPDEPSVEGAKRKIQTVATALHREAAGNRLIAQMEADLQHARKAATSSASKPKVLFIYARGSGTMNVSGRDTAADAMITLAGGQNAITGYTNYRPLTPEAVIAAAPDVILLLDRGLKDVGGIKGLLQQPGLALTPAGRHRRVVSMDDMLFLGFGPRLGQAVLELNKLLYTDANGG